MSEIIFHNTKSKREKKKTNRKTKDMVGTSENGSAAVPTNGEELRRKIRDRKGRLMAVLKTQRLMTDLLFEFLTSTEKSLVNVPWMRLLTLKLLVICWSSSL